MDEKTTGRGPEGQPSALSGLSEAIDQTLPDWMIKEPSKLRLTFVPYGQQLLLAYHRFQDAYIEYGPGAADDLGLAGQWGDLHRKVAKLKRAMWEGDPSYLTRESMPEILQDIIGHCLLALEMVERGLPVGRSPGASPTRTPGSASPSAASASGTDSASSASSEKPWRAQIYRYPAGPDRFA